MIDCEHSIRQLLGPFNWPMLHGLSDILKHYNTCRHCKLVCRKPIGGQQPEWLSGAESSALRMLAVEWWKI